MSDQEEAFAAATAFALAFSEARSAFQLAVGGDLPDLEGLCHREAGLRRYEAIVSRPGEEVPFEKITRAFRDAELPFLPKGRKRVLRGTSFWVRFDRIRNFGLGKQFRPYFGVRIDNPGATNSYFTKLDLVGSLPSMYGYINTDTAIAPSWVYHSEDELHAVLRAMRPFLLAAISTLLAAVERRFSTEPMRIPLDAPRRDGLTVAGASALALELAQRWASDARLLSGSAEPLRGFGGIVPADDAGIIHEMAAWSGRYESSLDAEKRLAVKVPRIGPVRCDIVG